MVSVLALTELQIYSHTCVRRLCIFVCFYVSVCVFMLLVQFITCVMCFECYVWCTSGLCFIISYMPLFLNHPYSRLLPIFTLLWIYLYKVCCTAKLPWCALARRDVMSHSVYHCIRVKVNKCWCKFNKILDLSISEKICGGCQTFNKSYYGVSNTKF